MWDTSKIIDGILSPSDAEYKNEARRLPEAFWLATADGGEALDLRIGRFEPVYAFDAVVFDVNAVLCLTL